MRGLGRGRRRGSAGPWSWDAPRPQGYVIQPPPLDRERGPGHEKAQAKTRLLWLGRRAESTPKGGEVRATGEGAWGGDWHPAGHEPGMPQGGQARLGID